MAEIEPLGAWSADAVAADCRNRVEPGDKLLCIWIRPDGSISWAKSELIPMDYAMFAQIVNSLSARAAEQLFEDPDHD